MVVGVLLVVFLLTGIVYHCAMLWELRESRRHNKAVEQERKARAELVKQGMFVMSQGGSA